MAYLKLESCVMVVLLWLEKNMYFGVLQTYKTSFANISALNSTIQL